MLLHKLDLPCGLPQGEELVVIGDIHGHSQLLNSALCAVSMPRTKTLLLLGDLINRGPDSKGVLDLIRSAEGRFKEVIVLPGNHEQMMWFASLDGPFKDEWRDAFIRNGGEATLAQFDHDISALISAMPGQLIQRLSGELQVWHKAGHLLFVHAGMDPLADSLVFLTDNQDHRTDPAEYDDSASPLWVRYAFSDASEPYKAPDGDHVLAIHGHTPVRAANEIDYIREVKNEITQWRLPLDATESGFMPLLEIGPQTARIGVAYPDANRRKRFS